MEEKSTVVSTFFGAFPSYCFPKATKDIIAHFFIRSRNSCNLYGERFEAAMYFWILLLCTILVGVILGADVLMKCIILLCVISGFRRDVD